MKNRSRLDWILEFSISLFTAIVAFNINEKVLHSNFPLFWAIIDFLFWPFVWVKWILLQEVNLTIIKDSFSFFLS